MKQKLRKILTWVRRIGLKGNSFTIVSNNCFAGFVYQKFGIKYNTPFIGLFILPPDYIELLKNFNELIKKKLIFIAKYKKFGIINLWIIMRILYQPSVMS